MCLILHPVSRSGVLAQDHLFEETIEPKSQRVGISSRHLGYLVYMQRLALLRPRTHSKKYQLNNWSGYGSAHMSNQFTLFCEVSSMLLRRK